VAYFKSNEHKYLQWLGLPFINTAFNAIIDNTIQLIEEYIDTMTSNLLIIWYFFGLMAVLLQIVGSKFRIII
jgi:ATP adenylyltransferase/5',5'''-P-1,P-4-tetraphosphate phosphorylase II